MKFSDADARPAVGQSIELHEATGASSLARVAASGADAITVAVPADTALATAPEPQWAFDLVWPGRTAVFVLPVTLMSMSGGPQLQLWELAPVGPARREARRRERRVAVDFDLILTMYPETGPVSLAAAMEAPEPLLGRGIDLSDHALQAVVSAGQGDALLAAGARVQCEFALPPHAGLGASLGNGFADFIDDAQAGFGLVPSSEGAGEARLLPGGAALRLRGAVAAAWTVDAPPLLRVVVEFDGGQPALDQVAHYVLAAAGLPLPRRP